jgi:hypothetical protein
MVVQGILDGFFNLYGISHQITFQYLQKIANANGYQLKRPLNTRKVLYKRNIAGGTIDTLQSLISLIFVFLAFIVNTKTIETYSKSRLKELKNYSTSTKNLEKERNELFTKSKKVIQNFLIHSRKREQKVYFLEELNSTSKEEYRNDLIDQEIPREDPVSFNSFRSIQSISPLPSNPQNSPILEVSTNDLLIDLPQLFEIDLQTFPQSVSNVFTLASDESESENEVELETSTRVLNENILEVAFKSAGEIINQVVSEPQEKTFENLLTQVNKYSGQSIVQRNINRIENDIKKQLELKKPPKKLRGGKMKCRKLY